MSINKNVLKDVMKNIKYEAERIITSLEHCQNTQSVKQYPEELLLHLIMLRSELSNLFYDLDDYTDFLKTIENEGDYDNIPGLDKYRLLIRKKWYLFCKNDTETREELNKNINEIYNNI